MTRESDSTNEDNTLKETSDSHHASIHDNLNPILHISNETLDDEREYSKLAPAYIILSNLQSGNNIGSICRNALAFNVKEVLIIGKNNHFTKMRGADRGAKSRLQFSSHLTHLDAKIYLQSVNCYSIYGVEIHPNAMRIDDIQFNHQPTAFVFGNEGGGLGIRQREICTDYVYIPQFAMSGMSSINVACASAIILYEFAKKSNYIESTRKGEKFV
jgi:tRNA G18 (ribose-2'-O)-methylase SpoU